MSNAAYCTSLELIPSFLFVKTLQKFHHELKITVFLVTPRNLVGGH
jgi:hypothetical protein